MHAKKRPRRIVCKTVDCQAKFLEKKSFAYLSKVLKNVTYKIDSKFLESHQTAKIDAVTKDMQQLAIATTKEEDSKKDNAKKKAKDHKHEEEKAKYEKVSDITTAIGQKANQPIT
ncbi:hypothetical protein RFI_35453 [Reticulomyxa filosa]|uniref:Uncharacterized protein n=1 Tax=Reticulomyxa filosa TaxID=46433 RepID=X6LKV7_RETFI|nr:hypothetical protein RFI_35453 [Reticulomyxa filosa]|eukprot:ETO01986.1 hypothetical protein RFI_35453 [Reticulomyxa filosa]